ncbi:HlyD family efflux transporter periplasmic adaptor subunit, partial [Mitsuaria sp. GD03876]|uniref:efflux RND transporter periplasmic adaptor subunit n=1 Tax=Mitsuaria sp. GD03876 TaxID=2975399 RepID=UPI00244CADAF
GAAAGTVAMARGRVDVEGGLLRLSPATSGVAQQVLVAEGQRIKRGQTLLTLDGRLADADVQAAEAEQRAAQVRLQVLRERLPALRGAAERLRKAAQAGATQGVLADEAQQKVEQAQSEAAIAEADLGTAKARLAQATARRDQLVLRAPEDGVVLQVAAHAGAHVPSETAALVVMPARKLIVRAEVNESFLSSIRPGMRAVVQGDGESASTPFPKARVLRLSPLFGASKLQDDQQRGPARTVECVIEFESEPQARVGQIVRVSFHE